MAGKTNLNYSQIKAELNSKGFSVTDVRMEDRLTIFFNCTNCGEPYQIKYVNYKKGQNPNLYCRDCQALKGPKMQRIQEYFDSKMVPITRVDLANRKHWYIYFPCAKCGSEVTIMDDYVGKNNLELRCKHCRSNTTVPTQESLEQWFKSRGSELLTIYERYHAPLKFKCTQCGAVAESDLGHLRSGYNPNLLCKACQGKDSSVEFFTFAEEKGLDVLGDYAGTELPVLVRCTRCGDPFAFHYGNYKWLGKNPYILCEDCRNDFTGRDPSKINSDGRSGLDNYYRTYVKEFFNISRSEWGKYNAHHIIRYIADSDYCTSLMNGYPLRTELHMGNFNYYHSGDGRLVENWGEAEKLPYHTYSNFRFLDLNSKFVSEILYPLENVPMKELYNRKKAFAEKGILYLPLYLTEMQTSKKRTLIYSMLRNRISLVFPDIYEYTGVKLQKFYARKLETCIVEKDEAEKFFNANHIQGFVPCTVYVGLKDAAGQLVSCMGFSKQRYMSTAEVYDFELVRFATLVDSVVVGGASKLFNYFIETYNPGSVVSFCDLRFSSFDPGETVYAKLGFEYAGYSKPNYWYRDPKTGGTKNRRSYQKPMLENKLEIFDDTLSETKNMEMNGYVMQVDCGNYKYVWRRS